MKHKNKPWLYITKYLIPTVLVDLIKDLPQEDQQNYCYIVNKIVIETRKSPTKWVFIGREYFRDFIRGGYKSYIEQLKTWKIIQVDESYCKSDDTKNGFTKSYRLHPSLSTDTIIVNYKKKQLNPMKDKTDQLTIEADPIIKFIHAQCQRITISDNLAKQDTQLAEVMSEYDAKKVYWKVFNVRYGKKVNRVYHSLITMPKTSRKNLIYSESTETPLFEYDIQSCHPFIFYKFVHESEKESYLQLLNDGFYETVAEVEKEFGDRDTIKKQYLHFMFGGYKNCFYNFFEFCFPKTLEWIKQVGFNSLASILQNIEASIIIDSTIHNILNRDNSRTYVVTGWNPLFIPQHDGWLGLERDEVIISQMVKDSFKDVVGIVPVITKKNIITGEKVVI